ncbi:MULTISPECIES: FMN reductase [Methylobacterium]|uniref:NADH-dependent FMN reductase SfnF n=1 Tax=Methylobacterium jeotgali TaxID=381630 RepID=A0ABQ4SQK4_9HYPH|nr:MULTISPECIES: FMN reductase [Methylobacterium]PIU07455.1 MAG: FMN reductase [Methylobacterium sp. CG09_land_8_20_14_0_10_71_15]PIU13991.1 MAG: FMN reductase [Methylobacterium sp. CG08_land_8_20_14_0_20_71_15]GBU17307.1 FMN reductase [Methylobacterium sp.]GJE05501.1 NADH-dependent FMN reductase SfnF [Methylobacterium jeotgali]
MTRPRLVGFSANIQRPSRTRTLVETIAGQAGAEAGAEIRLFDLLDAGTGLGAAWSREALPLPARRVVEAIEEADALVVGSPVYKGGVTGLFKHLFDLVEPTRLAGKPVAIAATGGGARHALVVEHALRPLFGFFGALQVPTAVYASDADFVDGRLVEPGVADRAGQAATELAALLGLSVSAQAPVTRQTAAAAR